jgi:hypothetical protein
MMTDWPQHALEGVVDPAVGQVDDGLHDVVDLGRIQRVGRPELPGELELRRIGVDGDDALGTRYGGALDDGEADATHAEDRDARTRLDLRGIEHRADAGRDRAAEQAHLVQRCVRADPGQGDLGQDGVLGERRRSHVVVDAASPVRDPARSIGHEPLALLLAQGDAQVRLAGEAEPALAAFGRVQGDDVVTRLHGGDSCAHLLHHAGSLVSENRREEALRVLAAQGVGIRVAHARGGEAHQHLAALRALEVDLVHDERLRRLERDRCLHLHIRSSLVPGTGNRSARGTPGATARLPAGQLASQYNHDRRLGVIVPTSWS